MLKLSLIMKRQWTSVVVFLSLKPSTYKSISIYGDATHLYISADPS